MSLLFLFLVTVTLVEGLEEVKIEQGVLRGEELTSTKGKSFSAFFGIPYAEPPVGHLRFQYPQEAKPWKGTFNALSDKTNIKCLEISGKEGTLLPALHFAFQKAFPILDLIDFLTPDVIGQEDCLVVNVYTDNLNHKDLKPVMVWIHGGAYLAGDGIDFYGPEHLIDGDIVLVTLNYRLGPLGFLTFLDDSIPANLGLFDQALALQWVKKNIKVFGGDPDKVTIFGESAGGMSVMNHLVSPQSQGLFRAAIAMSGFTVVLLSSRTLAARVGCDPEASTKSIQQCLKKVNPHELIRLQNIFSTFDISPVAFKPVIDGGIDTRKGPFLPKEPQDLVEEGNFNKVPLMIGFTKDDALVLTAELMANDELRKELANSWEITMPLLMFGREKNEVSDRDKEIARELLNEFFGGSKPTSSREDFQILTDLVGTAFFVATADYSAKVVAENSPEPVYLYKYAHQGSFSLTDLTILKPWQLLTKAAGRWFGLDLFKDPRGVSHVDEILLMFGQPTLPLATAVTEEDFKTRDNLVRLWTDFAKHKDPTPKAAAGAKWERLDPNNLKRMVINAELEFLPPTEGELARAKWIHKIWEELPPQMNRKVARSWQDPTSYDQALAKGNIEKSEF